MQTEKQCINCGNQFEAKRGSAVFCSTPCRVAYNRKQKSPESELDSIKKDIALIFDRLDKLEVGTKKEQPQPATTHKKKDYFKSDKPLAERLKETAEAMKHVKKAGKLPSVWMKEINALHTPHECQEKAKEVLADEYLKEGQKKALLAMMKCPVD